MKRHERGRGEEEERKRRGRGEEEEEKRKRRARRGDTINTISRVSRSRVVHTIGGFTSTAGYNIKKIKKTTHYNARYILTVREVVQLLVSEIFCEVVMGLYLIG